MGRIANMQIMVEQVGQQAEGANLLRRPGLLVRCSSTAQCPARSAQGRPTTAPATAVGFRVGTTVRQISERLPAEGWRALTL